MKNLKLWHIAVICVAVFVVFGLIGAIVIANTTDFTNSRIFNWSWRDDNRSFGASENYTIDETGTINISDIDSLTISTVSSKVNITTVQGSELTAHLYGTYASRSGQVELQVSETGSEGKVYVKYPKGGSGITFSSLTLDIELPEEYAKNISVNSVSGELNFDCENESFEDVKLGTTSGRIKFNTIKSVSNLKVNSVSGSITGMLLDGSLDANSTSGSINIGGLASNADVHTVSGRIELGVEEYADIDAGTTSGSVVITLENEGDFFVDFGSVSGSFKSDIPMTVENQKKSGFEGYYGSKNGAEFKVSTVSGSLKIEKNY